MDRASRDHTGFAPANGHGRLWTTAERAPAALTMMGTGTAPSHHGELLQGVFEEGGRLRRGLVTIPCSLFGSRATIRLSADQPAITVVPSWRTKALAAAHATLTALGLAGLGGRLVLHGNVKVGCGLGSSTSDVTATIFAVLAAARRHLPSEQIAQIAVDVETAADPLMFDRMLLFGQRDGAVIEDLYRQMIPIEVLGFVHSAGGLDTLVYPPARYCVWEVELFRALRGLLRRAVTHGDIGALGRIATASARVNQRFLPVPHFESLLRLAEDCGALGVQVAHSGTVAGLLFDPHHPRLETQIRSARRGLADLRFPPSWRYTSRNDQGSTDVPARPEIPTEVVRP